MQGCVGGWRIRLQEEEVVVGYSGFFRDVPQICRLNIAARRPQRPDRSSTPTAGLSSVHGYPQHAFSLLF
ncbi:hypothetical protein BDY24DRAFT_418054 [Mrakia frigida]|uniref:uncharacterized protein n=1 Tax=Mrakia frigida TaxID=29902 RepID=UPI003FCC2710